LAYRTKGGAPVTMKAAGPHAELHVLELRLTIILALDTGDETLCENAIAALELLLHR